MASELHVTKSSATEKEGLEVGVRVGVNERLRVDVNERVRIDVIERGTVRVGVQVAVGTTENVGLDV